MKTTFKMGKISFTAKKEGGETITKKLVAEDNVRLKTPIPLESTNEKRGRHLLRDGESGNNLRG